MAEIQAGITALVTAYARAYHATHESPKIFDDFLAPQLYTEEEHIQFDQNLAASVERTDPEYAAAHPDQESRLAWTMQTMHGPVTLSRSRYTEDCLEEAIRKGVEQYIMLGAGFDTFAFRRREVLAQLQVFEVDHPITQAMKRQRIAQAGWAIPPQLHFVPVDFAKESLTTALGLSGYDAQKLSFFSWLGVTFYLTRAVVFDTLVAVASISPRGSTIVFDYMDADSFIPEKADKRTRLMHYIARQVGEPMKTGFDPLTLRDELAQVGFALEENLSPEDIEQRYFRGRSDHYHAFEHVHFARAVVK
jgi:methyltransferase (TIGR00027 family)